MSNWISKKATVTDNVNIGENVSVYYNTVIRTETEKITIGEATNIQDNCVCHCDLNFPLTIGNYVTVGHMSILHGCTIGDNALIGMGTIIMNNAHIGNNCIIGAGSLVTENTIIPDNTLAFGRPAKIIRQLTEEEIRNNHLSALHYVEIIEKQIELEMK